MNRDLLADLPAALAGFGLTWLCQSGALLLLGLLAGRLLRGRGPAVQSTVYRTTLAAVLACPPASLLLGAAGFAGLNLRLPAADPAPAPAVAAPRPLAPAPPAPAPIAPAPLLADAGADLPGANFDPPTDPTAPPPAAAVEPPARPAPAPIAPAIPAARLAWVPTAVLGGLALWGLGATWLGLRMLAASRRMARLRAGSIPAGAEAEGACRLLAGRMGLATPAVLRSPFLSGPCVEGLRRPAILLPEDDDGLDLHAALVHELAHLARRDCLWNLLRRGATTLLWFQPLLWMLSRRIEVAAEEVCDDIVVQHGGDRARYAGLLLELAGRALPPLSPVGVGMVSLRSLLARRVVRILDSSRALSTHAGRTAVLATLLAGAAGTTLAGLVAVGGRTAVARADEAPPPAEAPPKTINGRVVDLAGRPVPAATVLALAWHSKPLDPGLQGPFEYEVREVARATTDADGRYAIIESKPALGPNGEPIEGVSHYITKPGYGVSPSLNDANLPLVPDDAPVTGRVVDLEGKPVARARVRPIHLYMPWPAPKDRAESAPGWFDIGKALGYGHDYLATLPPILTDADGRFRMDGVGRRRMVSLEITRPDLALKRVHVVARAMDHQPEPAGSNHASGFDEPGTHGTDCTIAVEPTRIIEGTVRDVESGAPIPGALVTARRLDAGNYVSNGDVIARADDQGRYRLVGLPKCKAPAVAVFPPLDRPYLVNDFLEVPVTDGYDPVTFDIPLRRARWITGRVFDLRSNKPVRAAVDYFPLLTNPRAKDYPNFDPNVASSSPGQAGRYLTDADGRFRVPGLPGAGVVTAHADEGAYRVGFGAEGIGDRINADQLPTYDRINTKHYQAIRPVSLPEADATVDLDLPLDPGGTLVLRFVDEAGAPVMGAFTDGLYPVGASGTRFFPDASTATVAGLEAGRPRTVLARHDDRRLGAVVEINADDPRDGRERVVVLRPLATLAGRIVGAAAPPTVRVQLEMRRSDVVNPPGAIPFTNVIDTARPDADGRFRLDALPAGGVYSVEVRDGSPGTNGDNQPVFEFKSFAPAVGLTVQPGQAVDLGTLDVTTGRKVEAPAPAPAPAAGPTTEARAGRIVNPAGRPVAGATVRVVLGHLAYDEPDRLKPRRELREVARATTDADGRYALTYEKPGPGPDGQPYDATGSTELFAQAPGFGPAPQVEGQIGPLVPDDMPITGRLVDPEGKPVAGATITPGSIALPRPGGPATIADLFGATANPGVVRFGNQYPDLLAPATSDADGRFRIDGVGRDRVVDLEIRRPGSALRRAKVATSRERFAEPPPDRNRFANPLDDPIRHGAECVIVVEPERLIAGQVRDAATGAPIPDAVVVAGQADRTRPLMPGDIMARTDAEGRYRLAGLPKGDAPAITVYPPVDRPYFPSQLVDVPAPPGYEPLARDVDLRAGVWVTGRLVDARTGAPVPAAIGYVPYLDNPAAREHANFRPGTISVALPKRHRTDAEGRFRTVGLPGRGVLLARTDSGDYRVGLGAEAVPTDPTYRGQLATYDRIMPNRYQALAAVDIPPGVAEFDRDLTVDPGSATLVRLVDEAGQPVAYAAVPHGRYPPGGETGSQVLYGQSSFRATGLEPGKGRTLVVRHAGRGLGAVAELPADRAGDGAGLTLVLRPTATVAGRLADAAGRPAAGTVTVLTGPGGPVTSLADSARNYRLATGPLDADGRFRLANIPAGGTYRVQVLITPDAPRPGVRPPAFDLAPIAPRPGEALDLGPLDAATGKPVAAGPAPAPPATSSSRARTGRVVGPDGRPIAGALVVALATGRVEPTRDQPRPRIGAEDPELARATADAAGRFALTYPEPDPAARPRRFIATYATAPGFGPARFADEPTITLPPDDFPVRGRVVDLEGNPVAGVSVRVQGLYEATIPASRPDFSPLVAMAEAVLPRPTTTDADGRFRLDGLGRDRLALVELVGPTVAYREAVIATRAGGWVAESGLKRGSRDLEATDDSGQHGAECTIALGPTRAIEGTVRDAATGAPIAGATVGSFQVGGGFRAATPWLLTTHTDARGHYRLIGVPRGAQSIAVAPPADRPYFITQGIPIPAGEGLGPISLDVPLRAGVWIAGRVADARTGVPVAAGVGYAPFLDNPAAAEYLNFQTRSPSGMLARVDADGRFRVVGLPGRGVVVARTDDPGYLPGFGAPTVPTDPAAKLSPGRLPTYEAVEVARYQAIRAVDIPPGAAEFAVDLPVDAGGSLVLRPVDAVGSPVTGVRVRHDQAPATSPLSQSGDAPTIRVDGLAAGRAHTLVVAGATLGAVVERPADAPVDGRDLAVTLRPTATVVGRVVDAAGEPVGGRANVEIRPAGAPPGAEAMIIGYASADRDGRFRVAGIPTGVAATVRFVRLADERRTNGFLRTPIAVPVDLQPGATVDLGNLDATTGKVVTPAPAPAFAPPAARMKAVTGRIVDAGGRPIPTAQVRAVLVRRAGRTRERPMPYADYRELARVGVDAEGRFALDAPEPGAGESVGMYASAPGYGPARFDARPVVTLPADDVPILGRVVDLEGRPVAGASLRVRGLYARPDEGEPAPGAGRFDADARRQVGAVDLLFPTPATTDADGRFRLDGLGRDRLATVEINGPTIALRTASIATRAGGWVADPVPDRPAGMATDDPGQHGAECTVAVEPTRVVQGTIRDAATGAPIPGALVASAEIRRGVTYREGMIEARADAQGRYRLVGLPREALSVSLYPPTGRPYFITQRVPIPATPGIEPVALDVALRAGIWIDGRVVDTRTGAAVAAAVDYFPFLDNPAAATGYPNFQAGVVMSGGMLVHDRTDADGRFRVVGLPGRGVVVARTDAAGYLPGFGARAILGDPAAPRAAPARLPTYDEVDPAGYQAVRAVDVPPGAAEFAVDLPVDPAGSIAFRPVDQAGGALDAVSVAHDRLNGGLVPPAGRGAPGPTVRVDGLEPGVARTFVLKQAARDLGAVVVVPADAPVDGRELAVTLRPTATVVGRVVDAAGEPVGGRANVDIRPAGAPADARPMTIAYAGTGPAADGRFVVAGVPTGAAATLHFLQSVERRPNVFKPTPIAVPVDLRPGATVDLGTLDAATGKPVAAIPAADLPGPPTRGPAAAAGRVPPRARPVEPAEPPDMTTGRVVDAGGRPIEGADVRAVESEHVEPTLDRPRARLDQRELARARTDAAGRFALACARPSRLNTIGIHVTAPGYGLARGEHDLEGNYEIKLPRDDLPVLGRVVDLEGRPVAGASVRVAGVRARSATAKAAPAGPDPAWFDDRDATRLDPSLSFPRPVATDGDGRFRLDGIGRDRLATVEITGPTIAHLQVAIVTRRGGRIADPDPTPPTRMAAEDPGQHGAECTIAVEPTRVVQGTIRDVATGAPIPGALVASAEIRRGLYFREGLVAARADAQGRYRLVGLPRDAVSISIYPPGDRPYFVTPQVPIPAAPGVDPVTLDVPLRAGVWITGRVAERQTDAPVVATVTYFPRSDNAAAPAYHNYRPELIHVVPMFPPAQTDAQGRYRVVGLPGRGVLAVKASGDFNHVHGYGVREVLTDPPPPEGWGRMLPTLGRVEFPHYQAIRAVDVPDGATRFVRDLPVVAGGSLVIRPVDPAGRPLTWTFLHGLDRDGGPLPIEARGGDGPTIRLVKLDPGVARVFVLTQAFFAAPGLGPPDPLAALLEQPADLPLDGRELRVTLGPAATVVGRVVDAAGEPVGGRINVEIRPAGARADAPAVNIGYADADPDGRFRVAGIPAGVAATVRFLRRDGELWSSSFKPTPIAAPVDLRPGATVDLGTLDAATGKVVRPAELAPGP